MPLPQRADLGQVQLRPQASPVDTYVRPAAKAPGLGQQLAAALQEYQPQIKQFLAKREEKKSEEETASARRQALVDGIASIGEVNEGKLHPDKSALWQKVYKDQQGRAWAVAKVAEARSAYDEGGFAAQKDGAGFDEFARKFVGDSLGPITDPDLINGALPALDQELTRLTLSNQAATAANQKADYINSAAVEIDGLISNEVTASSAEGRDFDPKAVWGSIDALKNRAKGLGMLAGEDINKLVVDSVVDHAERAADPTALDALKDQQWTDKSGKTIPGPFSNAYGRAKLRAARERIDARQVELSNQIYTLQERKKKQDTDAVLSDVAVLVASGNAIPPDLKARLVQVGGADALRELNSTITSQNSLITSERAVRDYDDAGTLHNVYARLLSGDEIDAQEQISLLGRIRDPNTVGRFYDDLKSVRDADGTNNFKKLRKVPGIRVVLDNIGAASRGTGVLAGAFGTDPAVALKVQQDLTQEVISYQKAHPELLEGGEEAVQRFNDHFLKRVDAYAKWVPVQQQARLGKNTPVGASPAGADTEPADSDIPPSQRGK